MYVTQVLHLYTGYWFSNKQMVRRCYENMKLDKFINMYIALLPTGQYFWHTVTENVLILNSDMFSYWHPTCETLLGGGISAVNNRVNECQIEGFKSGMKRRGAGGGEVSMWRSAAEAVALRREIKKRAQYGATNFNGLYTEFECLSFLMHMSIVTGFQFLFHFYPSSMLTAESETYRSLLLLAKLELSSKLCI